MISWILFICIVIVITIFINRVVRNGLFVVILTGMISTVAFQLIVAIQLGHIDKFALIAATVSFPVAILVSSILVFTLRKLEKVRTKRGQIRFFR
jgi:nucleoside permease NupC